MLEFILLRDGVCEGQFSKVLQVELLAIREACVKVPVSNILMAVMLLMLMLMMVMLVLMMRGFSQGPQGAEGGQA